MTFPERESEAGERQKEEKIERDVYLCLFVIG